MSAETFQGFVDGFDIDGVLNWLDDRKSVDRFPSPHAGYWTAMELVCNFGPITLERCQLIRFKDHFQSLISRSSKDSHLHTYPGLNIEGFNIVHALAMFTPLDQFKAEVLFSALRRAGLVTQETLRARCSEAGWIPIHLAAEVGNAKIIEEILKMDPSQILLTNNGNMSAGDIAEGNGLSAISTQLRDKERKERQKRQVASAISDMNPMVDTSVQPKKAAAVDDMMHMLINLQKPLRPSETTAPPDEDEDMSDDTVNEVIEAVESFPNDSYQGELDRLVDLITSVCRKVPHGPLMADAYVTLSMRLGIFKIVDLKTSLEDPLIACRYPSWFKSAVIVVAS